MTSYYTIDAEYHSVTIDGQSAVRRGDGDYSVCDTECEADALAEALAAGSWDDSEVVWVS